MPCCTNTQTGCDRQTFHTSYTTPAGVRILRHEVVEPECTSGSRAIDAITEALDARRGLVLASSTEVPGRYSRWDRGFVDPPIAIEGRASEVRLRALNERGEILLPALSRAAARAPGASLHRTSQLETSVLVETGGGRFSEEERSRQPSSFGVLRSLVEALRVPEDPDLGFYGAFGYDLAFQFEPIPLRHPRSADQRDLVLYLPDELIVVDHQRASSHRVCFDFEVDGHSTVGRPREGESVPYQPGELSRGSDHEPGEYAQLVRRARQAFGRGDLFEVVPSQVLSESCPDPPSRVFRRTRERNPSPYGFLVNLGEEEYLVGASPEMFVRVGEPGRRDERSALVRRRVETCPIAGTVARGADPLQDADQILELLSSRKDAAELTMCTDVDRNDKSRVCEPGSVRILGRRQIELYSRLIHTVDHVEGRLLEERDALDAFLSHAWAVTVTGAPKRAAMAFIEDNELSPRRWYGGAVGFVGADGRLDTGLVLRTIRIAQGIAETRVGATLLYDSDPDAEEQETRLKASALLDALRNPSESARPLARVREPVGAGKRILLVDAQDSFVHTLGSYFRRTGARVKTLRAGFPTADLSRYEPDAVVLSPGPGRPSDFGLAAVIDEAVRVGLPVFGVCLGLQAIAEHAGGELGVLPEPVHGKPSRIHVLGGRLFEGVPRTFTAGRYHSLVARRDSLPPVIEVTAVDDAGVVMALEHRTLPLWGVQFHPESLLSAADGLGLLLIENCVRSIAVRERRRVSRAWPGEHAAG